MFVLVASDIVVWISGRTEVFHLGVYHAYVPLLAVESGSMSRARWSRCSPPAALMPS